MFSNRWKFSLILSLSLAIFAALTIAMPEKVSAQASMARSMFASGVKAYNAGNYSEALTLLRRANELGDQGKYTNDEMAQARLGLAETLRVLGYYKESEKYFGEALEFAQKGGKMKKPVLSMIYNSCGGLQFSMSKFPEAEQFFKDAIPICPEQQFLPLNNLANLYLEWGKLEEAQPYLKKSQSFAANKKYRKTLAIPYSYFNRAHYAFLRGDYDSAEKDYQKALDSCESLFGNTHHYYGISVTGLANLYRKQSRYQDAEMAYRTVLSIRKSTFGESHECVAETLVQLATVLAEQGKYAEASKMANQAIEICQKIFSDNDNSYTAKARACLGNMRRQDGRYEEAADLLSEAHAMQLRLLGRETLDTIALTRDLAKVRIEQSKYDEAERLLKSVDSALDAMTGPDHPERAETAGVLASLYIKQGKLDPALAQLHRAQDLTRRVFGENHSVIASSARDLGELYFKKKQYDAALEQLSIALSIDEKIFGNDSPQVAADLLSLAAVHETEGDHDKAGPLSDRAAKIREKHYGDRASAVAEIRIPASFASATDRPVRSKWALSIGISNFKDPSINLKYAAKDATDFSNFLVEKARFDKDHVKLLTDENATRQNIIDMLGSKWLGDKAQKDDLVVVYVSSHGSHSLDDAGGVNFLVAHDTDKNSLVSTGIPMQWLTKIIKEQVPSERVILVLDVCHSGAAAAGGKGLSRVKTVDPTQLKIGTGQMVLCSSMAEQVSWESKKYENSVFTRCLMDSLTSNADQTTMLSAYKRLKTMVESEVLQDRANLQTPILFSKEWVGGDPIIAVEPLAERKSR